jgi:S1-C subfamily serine protease
LALSGASDASDPRESVVKIYAEHRYRDYRFPWHAGIPYSTTGSGVVIEGNRILTNAHVVSDQTFLQVRLHGRSERHVARLVAVSHDSDLAVLSVDDPGFFEGVPPLPLGELPEAQQRVVVCGFPMGGDTLSATAGIVSRIEQQSYAHSGVELLAVQIDAAVNPGNSGGPVIADGKVLGVVMQGYPGADSIGYFIPTPVIRHFLEDLEDGSLQGLPFAGFLWQALESESLQKFVGWTGEKTGVLITRVLPRTPAAGKLLPRDVLVAIDGKEIAPDGTIELAPQLRSSLTHAIQQHQIGDRLELQIARDGRTETVELVLDLNAKDASLVLPFRYDVPPTYFIYGGLVFSPLSANYVQSFQEKAPPRLSVLQSAYRNRPAEEIVVLNRVLPSRGNMGYQDWENQIVTKMNGHRFGNLAELVHLIETTSDPFVLLENEEGLTIALERKEVEAERETLLLTYGIPSDRSDDVPNSRPLAASLSQNEN